MATDKRIGPCNSGKVRLLHGRGLNIYSAFMASALVQNLMPLFCPNEQYLGVYLKQVRQNFLFVSTADDFGHIL